MASLIKSMKWDEDTFGLEYDLDLFNIVAVDDFNMGAMENKSLNIFNSRLVLATPRAPPTPTTPPSKASSRTSTFTTTLVTE